MLYFWKETRENIRIPFKAPFNAQRFVNKQENSRC